MVLYLHLTFLKLPFHYSLICSDLPHTIWPFWELNRVTRTTAKFYIFFKQIFFNSSNCCIHFPCRQVHRPFISVNFDSLNRGIHFFSVNPLLQDIHSVGVCIDNACVWWTLTPFFFSVFLSPFINPSFQHVLNFLIK